LLLICSIPGELIALARIFDLAGCIEIASEMKSVIGWDFPFLNEFLPG
jgi:hypothetical protein